MPHCINGTCEERSASTLHICTIVRQVCRMSSISYIVFDSTPMRRSLDATKRSTCMTSLAALFVIESSMYVQAPILRSTSTLNV